MYYSFPNLEPVHYSMSSSNCCFLTCIQISQEAGKVIWYFPLLKNFPQFVVTHIDKGFGVVNKAEVYVFPGLSCFFYDPMGVGNLISGSHVFSKFSFTVHILLKPCLENFEHYFTIVWDERSFAVVGDCLSLGWEWKLTFSSPVATVEFSKCAGI